MKYDILLRYLNVGRKLKSKQNIFFITWDSICNAEAKDYLSDQQFKSNFVEICFYIEFNSMNEIIVIILKLTKTS